MGNVKKKMGNVKKRGKNTTFSKIVKKGGKPEIVNKKHKNDTITSKKGTFLGFF